MALTIADLQVIFSANTQALTRSTQEAQRLNAQLAKTGATLQQFNQNAQMRGAKGVSRTLVQLLNKLPVDFRNSTSPHKN